MRRSLGLLFGVVGLLALTLAVSGAAEAAKKRTTTADEQLDFGVKMARKGLWSEALFRFDQARRLDPGNVRILNNVAVAYEATGRFEQALEAYQDALAADPGNRDLRRNYSQFLEFYQSFKPAEPEEEGEPGGADPGG